jgi:hypothetical protein
MAALGAEIVAVKVAFTKDLSPLFAQAGLKSVYATGKAIDEAGNKTKTRVIRAVAAQAGVKVSRARGIIRSQQAMGAGGGQYVIIARDATLSLKEFDPRVTRKGVSAAPWGKRRVFAHSFVGPNGHVFIRKTKGRLPIKKLWGPNIPKEMVKDQAEATFYRTVGELLPTALEKWLLRAIG